VRFLIVGAGQLGSRHAASLAKFGEGTEIHLIDPNEDSLEVCAGRILATGHSINMFRHANFKNISGRFDFVIVATSSQQRLEVIEHLLQSVSFSYILIEKLVVPNLGMLEKFTELAQRLPTTAWVNCPMPYFPHYVWAKESLKGSPIKYEVVGSNLGLITNAVHYLDHFVYLARELPYNLRFSENSMIIDSKRRGYSEAVGTIEGSTKSGHTISISFSEEMDPRLNITITNDSEVLNYDEITCVGFRLTKSDNEITRFEFKTPLQSELTYSSAVVMFREEEPKWAKLSDSLAIHQVLFAAIQNLVMSKHPEQDLKFT
jgi:hypothetical protein